MDTITQAALGACIAQAGFSDKLGRKAIAVGMVCGILPDFDFLFSIGGNKFTYLATHRSWSHSLLVLPLIAFPIAWLAMKWGARNTKPNSDALAPSGGRYWIWYLLSFLALITHPLLDLFTSYGTQIFTPLSNARYSLDGVSIIDPIYTIPLIIALVVGLIVPNKPKKHRKWAQFALVFSTLYLCLGLFNSWDAKRVATNQLVVESFKPVDLRVSPTIFNNLLWRVVAKDSDERYAVGFFSSITRKDIKFRFYESDRSEFVNKAIASHEGKILHWFSTDMLKAQVINEKDGSLQVVLIDMRFGLVTQPLGSFFNAVFEFDHKHNISSVHTAKLKEVDPVHELKSIWFMIWDGC